MAQPHYNFEARIPIVPPDEELFLATSRFSLLQ